MSAQMPTTRPELQRNFHLQGSQRPRPSARGVIYCDGGTDDLFRERAGSRARAEGRRYIRPNGESVTEVTRQRTGRVLRR